jgi:calcineurin-like phosphoesterase family protein
MPGQTWFTADTHFWHGGIIGLTKRPFSSAEEMTHALIANWNARVRPGDTVYHIGDFAVRCGRERAQKTLDQLNGHKILLRGNHDENRFCALDGWDSVHDILETVVEGQRLVLCHYAMRAWPGQHRGALMLYGHSHGRLPGTRHSLDVGVDCWNYFPVSLDEIRARLTGLPDVANEEAATNQAD